MPSVFGIAAAAFAIGMATNPGMPPASVPTPGAPAQQSEIIVHDAASYSAETGKAEAAIPVPRPRPIQDHAPEEEQRCDAPRTPAGRCDDLAGVQEALGVADTH